MRNFQFLAGLFIAAAALHAKEPAQPQPAPTPVPTLREEVNALDPSQIQKAVEALRSNFISPAALDETSKQRALLEGLVGRLAPGAAITAPDVPRPGSEPLPFLAEILDGRAGYLRPGLLDADTLGQMDVALDSFTAKKIPAVILDLRAVPRGSGFDVAADFAKRFCPKGKMLFTIEKPSRFAFFRRTKIRRSAGSSSSSRTSTRRVPPRPLRPPCGPMPGR